MTGLRGSILSLLLALTCPALCVAQGAGAPTDADVAADVQRLMDQLGSRHAADRLAAMESLAELGPAAADAVYVLSGMLADDDAANRRAAIRTMGAIGPAALGELAMVKYNDDAGLRKLAVKEARRIVWRADTPPEGALDVFLEGMADPDTAFAPWPQPASAISGRPGPRPSQN